MAAILCEVGASGKTVSRAKILVLAETHAIEPRRTPILIRDRFDVVDAAPFPIIRAGGDETEFLAGSETAAECGGLRSVATAALDGRVTAQASDLDRRRVGGGLGDKIH